MIFKQHSDLVGKHAFLSASKYHWLNYDDEKLADAYGKHMDAALGTRLHALAAELISMGVKLPNTLQTLNMYVNDCIGYRMQVEKVLFYSYNAFGTADAIDFDPRNMVLRIFDLKNGVSPTKETQLEVYAGLFNLEYGAEYGFKPTDLEYDLRIYQNDEIRLFETDPERILHVMHRIIEANKLINEMKGV